MQCLDKLDNLVKHGGEDFSSDNYIISEEKYTSFEVKINDLNNGNYSFNFKPSVEGNYYIIVYLDNELFIEINFEIGIKHCDNSTPFNLKMIVQMKHHFLAIKMEKKLALNLRQNVTVLRVIIVVIT